jgi:PAS domain S-box-containing protein
MIRMARKDTTEDIKKLRAENEELRLRLTESEEALQAIRNGEVDAIIVTGSSGDKIFSLTSADTPYRIIMEEMDEGAVIISGDGTILYHNQMFAKLFGNGNEQFAGTNIHRFISGPEQENFKQLLRQGLEGKANGKISIVNNGSTIYLHMLLRAMPADLAGEICIIFSDITQMQLYQNHLHDLVKAATLDIEKANEKLKNTQQKLNNALENGNIGIWEWDFHTGNVFIDARTEKTLGLLPGTFQNTFQAFKSLIHEEDLFHFENAITKAVAENIPLETVYRLKESHRFISVKASISLDGDGVPARLAGVCFDISDLKRSSERNLLRLSEELLRSNKELENFAYIASHDLKEPLRMVSSFTGLLAKQYEDKLDERAQEYIFFAKEGARRMYDLLDGLLAYSRIHTKGKEFTGVDLNLVMDSVIKNLSLVIKERNAAIRYENLPVIFADESQMILLFQNLISNGIKFSTEKPEIFISSKSENHDYVFSVKDNGMGIDSEYFDRVFLIFQRLMPRAQYEGTGIGLAICKRIIERHEGKIWIESKPGYGSTFIFTIPKN